MESTDENTFVPVLQHVFELVLQLPIGYLVEDEKAKGNDQLRD